MFLPEIKRVIATAFAEDPTDETLNAMVERVRSSVSAAQPGLTEEAVRAVSAFYAFCWK